MPLFYPLFALGCGAGITAAISIRLRYRSPPARIRAMRHALRQIARAWLGAACALGLLDWEARNRPPPAQGRLLVANHPTLIDVLFIIALEPDICCVLKADLNRNRVFAVLIRSLDYLSNADPERLLVEGERRLRRGETLLIFPEGTRTVPGQPVVFRQGAATIAIRAQAPVQPVVIHYRGAYLSKGHPWYRLPRQRVRYRFCYGPAYQPPEVAAAGPAQRRARRQLNDWLETHMASVLARNTLPKQESAAPARRWLIGDGS